MKQFYLQIFYEPQQRSTTIKSTESINTIEIFDLSGRQINSLKSINSKDITLDFNSQFNGLYILKIYVDKNVFSHKLMGFLIIFMEIIFWLSTRIK